MDDGEAQAQPRRTGERHGWLALERYVAGHEGALERHPFVLEDLTVFDRPEDSPEAVTILGQVVCAAGIVIHVQKSLTVRRSRRNQLEVRGHRYRYHVHIPGRGDLLRYDNSHDLGEFHRHEFEFPTQRQKPLQYLTREEFPTLIEVIDEVRALARRLGLAP